MLKIERIYTKPFDMNGYRILVDRLWARGISKQGAKLNQWSKDIAPSTKLRKWFQHKNVKFQGFMQKYLHEIRNNAYLTLFVKLIRTHLKKGNVILLYGAKNAVHNNAVVLRWYLNKRLHLGLKPDLSFVNLLYNDGSTNKNQILLKDAHWLSQHRSVATKLGLRANELGKIYHDRNKMVLNHQQLLQIVLNH